VSGPTVTAEDLGHDLEIRRSTYEWSVRLFRLLERILKVNVKLHQSEGQAGSGEVFVFNHFARFETFIPQYLIYRETGALSRSLASSEFFVRGDPFSIYLLNAGAVPNNLAGLLPFLAREVLRGHKVIMFPEGGMVKDRRAIDERGRYRVYSRMSARRRRHHSGAAVLALGLELFRRAVLAADRRGERGRLELWVETLGLDGIDSLLSAARRPTAVVPANITFYPIRVDDNLLRRGAHLLSKGRLSRRLSEELMVEGNILLSDTDMDVRLGDPIRPGAGWSWIERRLVESVAGRVRTLEEAISLAPAHAGWRGRLLAPRLRHGVGRLRDAYMQRMYAVVTVNLSHLASSLVMALLDSGRVEVEEDPFRRMLYLAVKTVQRRPLVHLHRSLRNPEAYGGLLEGRCRGFHQFLAQATASGLMEALPGCYRFLPKLRAEHAFDEIRLENPVAVYANEVAPVEDVGGAVRSAIVEEPIASEIDLARLRFDDERLAYAWDRARFSKPKYTLINEQQTATESGEPFLLVPERRRRALGVVLVHGFIASPAEMRPFAERLARLGHPVMGVRLKGHGTSPWDLRERRWEDWLASVERGFSIVRAFAPRIAVVGFSTGGTLALRLAADVPEGLSAVVGIAVALRFRNRNMVFVPIVHGANRLVGWVSSHEGLMPFRSHRSEHPHINYRHMPIRGLYELRRLADDVEDRLPEVRLPVLLLQGSADPVVEPSGAHRAHARLGSNDKRLVMIPSERHGILYEDIGDTQRAIIDFLAEHEIDGSA